MVYAFNEINHYRVATSNKFREIVPIGYVCIHSQWGSTLIIMTKSINKIPRWPFITVI